MHYFVSFNIDLYQITMAYGYWKNNKKDDIAVFDLFFRKNPFHGEFTIFAGVEECIKFLDNFKFSEEGRLPLSCQILTRVKNSQY